MVLQKIRIKQLLRKKNCSRFMGVCLGMGRLTCAIVSGGISLLQKGNYDLIPMLAYHQIAVNVLH